MCHLRGLLMLKLNRNDRAKECFLEALALDVKCYDAFEQLVGGELMRPDEGNFFSFQYVSIYLSSTKNGNLSKVWLIRTKHLMMRNSFG
jgi:hypothetical protein